MGERDVRGPRNDAPQVSAGVATPGPAAPPTSAASPTPAASPRVPRVLAIDDEPRFLASLRLALEGAYHVETCAEGATALAVLAADPARFDVVLCDLSMPGMDGVAFYERLEALGIADRFVLMSGGAFTPRTAAFVACNVCPMISKPFPLEQLLTLLAEMTRRSSLR